jgi:hypothetical protein
MRDHLLVEGIGEEDEIEYYDEYCSEEDAYGSSLSV